MLVRRIRVDHALREVALKLCAMPAAPNTLMFEYISPRILDRSSAYTVGLLQGTDAAAFPQGVTGLLGFSTVAQNCTGTILRMFASF